MSLYNGRGINPQQFREYVIRPTLRELGVYTEVMEELLFMTAAHESLGGRLLHQENGSALGVYQIEPTTHQDIWINYLSFNDRMRRQIMALTSKPRVDNELIVNMRYATAMAYLVYHRAKDSPPSDPSDVWGLSAYYKLYYNTYKGSATLSRVVEDYEAWV